MSNFKVFLGNSNNQAQYIGQILDDENAAKAAGATPIPSQTGQSGKVLTTNGTTLSWAAIGSGGSSDYNDLVNRPSINNVTLSGNQTSSTLGLQPTLVSGTNIKTVNNNSLVGSGNINIDSLPSQTSQSGKFLTTNGTSASWANVPTEIPSQSGNSGKFLTTNGSTVSWANVDALPSQTSQSGKFLTTNGTSASWSNIPTEIPSQTGNSGKFLTTNGSSVSWATVSSGSSDYDDLTDKPSINSVTLTGNKTSSDLGLASDSDVIKNTGGSISSYLSDVLSTPQVRNISVGSTMPSNPVVGDIHFVI